MNIETQELKTFRRYLLGLTPETELADIEERMLRDDDFYQELLIAEDDLVDEYWAEKLSTEELNGFHSNFLVTAERREKLRFSKAFRTYLAEAVLPEPATAFAEPAVAARRKWYQSFLPAPDNRVLAFSTAALVLAAVLTISFLAFRSSRSPSVGTPSFAVTLSPGLTRGGGENPRVSIPADKKVVQFQLEVMDNTSQFYKAELIIEAKTLMVRNQLSFRSTPNGRTVDLDIPAEELPPGDYRIRLSGISGSGESAPVGTFAVRITR